MCCNGTPNLAQMTGFGEMSQPCPKNRKIHCLEHYPQLRPKDKLFFKRPHYFGDMAEVMVSKALFREILERISRLRMVVSSPRAG